MKAIIFHPSKAMGDRLFISWVPKFLKRKQDVKKVHFATFKKNLCIIENNPFINKIIHLEDYGERNCIEVLAEFEKEYDIVYDLRHHVEGRCLEFTTDKNSSIQKRRDKAKGINYYDAYRDYNLVGGKPEIYLTTRELQTLRKYRDGKKRILWHSEGSGRNKKLSYMPGYIRWVLDNHPDIENWIAGTGDSAFPIFDERLVNMLGKWSGREALVMTGMFNLVVGPESFFINAACAHEVPTLTFYSHSLPENLTGNFKNAYWVQPKCDCHPCYCIRKEWRTVYDLDRRRLAREKEKECLAMDPNDLYRVLGYKCCVEIDHNEVVSKLSEIIQGWH